MRRRDFIGLFGGAAIARPLSALAQQAYRIRKIGILANFPADDPEGQARVKGFTHALEGLGWSEGTNLHTETRWAGDNAERYPQFARELVALEPRRYSRFSKFKCGRTSTGHSHRADCFCECDRSGRSWVHCEYGAPRRQHNRIYCVRIQHQR